MMDSGSNDNPEKRVSQNLQKFSPMLVGDLSFCSTGDGAFEEPAADGIDGGVAAIGEDCNSDPVTGCESNPGAAIVAAAVFFQESAGGAARQHGPAESMARG